MFESVPSWVSSLVLKCIGYGFLVLFLFWLVVVMFAACVLAVLEERKLWKPCSLPSLLLWGMYKVFLWNLYCSVGFLGMAILVLLKYIVTFGRSDVPYDAHVIGERTIMRWNIWTLIGTVKIVGQENLPPDDIVEIPAPVYVANHASQIDTGAIYLLHRRFKWVAKSAIAVAPGVGQLMLLAQHVFIQRTGNNQGSVSNLFEKSNQAVQQGIPMFFFPQGTRCMAERKPFKHGAFTVALNNKSRIIPVSIDIPRNAWNSAYPLNLLWGGTPPVVTLTVHPAIVVTDNSTKEELVQQCVQAIYSAVPTILQAETVATGETAPLMA